MLNLYALAAKIIAAVLIIGTLIYVIRDDRKLREQLIKQQNNVTSYQQGVQVYKDPSGTTHAVSIQQAQKAQDFKDSKDSLQIAMLDSISKYKILLKNVQQVGVVTTTITARDTVKLTGIRDTTFAMNDKQPYITEQFQVKDGKFSRDLEIKNKQSLIWNSLDLRKNGKPASRIFFVRWFQSIHKQYNVDVVNSNPYIKTDQQQFIIIDK